MSEFLNIDPIHTGSMSRRSAATGDTTAPVLTSGPQNGQGADAALVFTFSESVKLGNGTITLRTNNGLSHTETLAGSPYVSVSGNTLSFKPPQRLAYATSYWVEISANAVLDLAGNPANSGMPINTWFTSGLSPVALNLTGTSGADTMDGSDLADTIDGLAGQDTLNGHGGDDILRGGDETMGQYYHSGDQINGGDGNDVIEGGAGTDFLRGGTGNDRLAGGADDDIIYGDEGDDVLDGGAGNDSLSGGTGSNTLLGGEGDDSLSAEHGSSGRLDGGAGNDKLGGAGGALEYDGGIGNDQISLRLSGAAAGTTLVRGGDGDDSIRVEFILFTQATVNMAGGAGRDTFGLQTYSSPDGGLALTITDFTPGAGADVLDLLQMYGLEPGVNPFASGHMRLLASGSDTVLQLRNPTIPAGYSTLVTLTGVQPAQLVAANFSGGIDPRGGTLGVTLTGTANADTLNGMLLDDTLLGLDGADFLHGGGGNDTLDGGAGNDTLDGGVGSNLLRGGAGDDELRSSSVGTNRLEGGAGNDRISGGAGTDTLVGGDGDDDIMFAVYDSAGRVVTLDGGDGADTFRIGYAAGPVVLGATGGAGNDTYVISSYTAMRITDFSLGDRLDLRSLLGPLPIAGNPFGAAGYMKAVQEGSAVAIYVDGDGAAGSASTWRLAVALDNVQLGALSAASFVGGFDPSGTSQGLNLTGTAGADVLTGEALNDTINGGDGSDTIDGGGGDDQLFGGDESVLGAGDRIAGGDGDDQLRGGTGSDSLDGGAGNDLLWGDSGDDRLEGGWGNDRLEGGDGRDTLSDSEGSDYLSGGAGNDNLSSNWSHADLPAASTLDGGSGDDTISAGSSVKTVIGGAGDDVVSIDARGSAANTVTMEVDLGDGKDRVNIGYAYTDTRAVRISGGLGTDTYSFSTGERAVSVTITDFQLGAGGDVVDLFSFAYNYSGGNPFGSAGYARLVQDGSRVLFQFDADGAAGPHAMTTRIVFENALAADFTADNFTEGARPDGQPGGLTIVGAAANDTLQGGRLDDTLRGAGGNDYLYGNDGADLLQGEDGNDSLYGGNGGDRLDGGIGDDFLDGGEGNDELLGGPGKDVLSDSQGNNILRGGDGDDNLSGSSYGSSQVYGDAGNDTLSSSGGSGLLDGGIGDDQIRIDSYWGGAGPRTVEARGDEGRDSFSIQSGGSGGVMNVLLTGGSGIDTFSPMFSPSGSTITVTDFSAGAGGDLLDIANVALPMTGNPFAVADGSVRLVQRGLDTVLQARKGSNDSVPFQDVLVLSNVNKDELSSENILYGFNPDGSRTGQTLLGSAGAGRLAGSWLDDTLSGAEGNDILSGSMGNDRLNGGDGDDQLDGDKIDSPPPGLLMGGNWPVDPPGDDVLDGGAGNDTLTTSWGNDTMLGGQGDDLLVVSGRSWYTPGQPTGYKIVLDGGEGQDRIRVQVPYQPSPDISMSGGAGSDTFELSAPPQLGSWTITDFQAGSGGDVLDIFESLGWMRQNPFASYFMRLEQRGLDTVVQVDADGMNGPAMFTDLVTLKNVAKAALTADNMRYGHAPDGTPVALGPLIEGGAGSDRLQGSAAADDLRGGDGNDVLAGAAGNDLLQGGSGNDSAVFSGKRSEYSLQSWSQTEMLVTDLRAGVHDGKDRLVEVERMVFADTALALDTGFNGVAGQAYRIYRAAFDRPADEGGLGFWMAMMDRGTSLRDIAGGFVRSQEFIELYGATPTNAEIVTRMYTNILDRAPEQAGYDYWLAALDKKLVDVPSMLGMFSQSNENYWAVAELIANGVTYQPFGG